MPPTALRALPVLGVVVLAVSMTASAAGFDVTGPGGGSTITASGHTAVEACSDELVLDRQHVFVDGEDDDAGTWMVEVLDVSGPADLDELCDGWTVTLAVEVDAEDEHDDEDEDEGDDRDDDGELDDEDGDNEPTIILGPLTIGPDPQPGDRRFVLDEPVANDAITSIAVLLEAPVVIELGPEENADD